MDNNTFHPHTADALLASSNGFQQSTPPQSPDKKRLLNDKETNFIETLRNIERGRISQPEEFDPALSGLSRQIANDLLQAMQKKGIEGYWKSYTAIFYDRIGLRDPAPQPLKQESKARPSGYFALRSAGEKGQLALATPSPIGKIDYPGR